MTLVLKASLMIVQPCMHGPLLTPLSLHPLPGWLPSPLFPLFPLSQVPPLPSLINYALLLSFPFLLPPSLFISIFRCLKIIDKKDPKGNLSDLWHGESVIF